MKHFSLPFFLHFLLILLVTGSPTYVKAQTKQWKWSGQLNIGCQFNLNHGKGQAFPGLKFFSGFGASGIYNNHIIVNYGPSISIYTKMIGANLNPLVGDIQVDFTNSISFGYGWGPSLDYMKYFRTIHTGEFYNIATNKKDAILLSSNFILNNHHRNQVVGAITLSIDNVTFNYANDGAIPFDIIPLGDNFDRYWTGTGGLFIHNRKGYNTVEVSFDQFTGYTPLLYELSNLIGINIPLYDESDTHKTQPYTYNTSNYNVRIFLDRNFGVDFGITGSLISNKGYHYGAQDLIHIALKYPLHPNDDGNKKYIGGTYTNFQHVAL